MTEGQGVAGGCSKFKLTKGHGGGEDDTGDEEGYSWVKVERPSALSTDMSVLLLLKAETSDSQPDDKTGRDDTNVTQAFRQL